MSSVLSILLCFLLLSPMAGLTVVFAFGCCGHFSFLDFMFRDRLISFRVPLQAAGSVRALRGRGAGDEGGWTPWLPSPLVVGLVLSNETLAYRYLCFCD